MLKISDYIVSRLVDFGVKDVFMLSGGGIMHLMDSLVQNVNINYYCNLHEQASAICADAYAQVKNTLGVCLVTTGPGATNAITGCASSFVDSRPVLFISGQVKREDLTGTKKLRQVGVQEINIVEMVKPITKYAETILDPSLVKYHLDKARYLALSGNKGPVWLDVPLDIQGMQFEESSFLEFDQKTEFPNDDIKINLFDIKETAFALAQAERPVILVGNRVDSLKAISAVRTFIRKNNFPVLATVYSKMIFEDDEDLFFGYPGMYAPRYSSLIIQNSDCVIMLGVTLTKYMTAYNHSGFAPKAKKIMIDIDEHELRYHHQQMKLHCSIHAVIEEFVERLNEELQSHKRKDISSWFAYCREVRDTFPIHKEYESPDLVNPYLLAHKLNDFTKDNDVIVSSSSGTCDTILAFVYKRRKNQIFAGYQKLGSMGFALPTAIGASIASGKHRTITVEGDGSLQHNLQELALIKQYELPIKLFVINNGGYVSIKNMQKNHFDNRFIGCDKDSGVNLCDLKLLAELYCLHYYRITCNDEVEDILKRVMDDDAPVLCEVFVHADFDPLPKAVTTVHADGSITSSSLENLFPFLSNEEQKYWMRF